MRAIWNEVVRAGNAFPQFEELTDDEEAEAFFASQTRTAVAVDCESAPAAERGADDSPDSGKVVGLYILHPNNVGRCGHIANASYAVDSAVRGKHMGKSWFRIA